MTELTRDDLVIAITKGFTEHCRDRPWLELSVNQTARIMLDIAGPMIRDHEREYLHAKVEAMRYTLVAGSPVVFKDEVLALIDGGQ